VSRPRFEWDISRIQARATTDVLRAVTVKIAVSRDVTPCGLVKRCHLNITVVAPINNNSWLYCWNHSIITEGPAASIFRVNPGVTSKKTAGNLYISQALSLEPICSVPCIRNVQQTRISANGSVTLTPWLFLVRKRTIPTERPPLVGKVGANFRG
jgi:hypothetical protein